MVSRENRAIAGSFVLFVLAFVGLGVLEMATGVAVTDQPLVIFLLLAVPTVVGPQLYLAATDADVSPRTRIRFAVIATGVFAAMVADGPLLEDDLLSVLGDPRALQNVLIVTVAVGAFVGLVCYEFVAGYRSRAGDAGIRRAG